jgi:hypothetical protein
MGAPFVAIVALLILPVLLVVSAGFVAFPLTIAAITTTSTTPLCKGGALRLGHSGDYSLTVLVQ